MARLQSPEVTRKNRVSRKLLKGDFVGQFEKEKGEEKHKIDIKGV